MCSRDSFISMNVHETTSEVKSSEECWKCWNFPHIEFKKEVKIENPKYCWIYPRLESKKLKKVEPILGAIQTLYTKCDFKLEQCVHAKILLLEKELKIYEKLFQKEINFQAVIIENIWELSFRYMLLKNSSCCVKCYPEIVSLPTERRALCGFFEILSKINLSNRRLTKCLRKIRTIFSELGEQRTQLDLTVESPFLQGKGVLNLPLHQVYEMLSDIIKYFCGTLCKLKCWAQLLDPADTPAVNDYKYLLQSLDDFDGFLMFRDLECTCRRSKIGNCIERQKSC